MSEHNIATDKVRSVAIALSRLNECSGLLSNKPHEIAHALMAATPPSGSKQSKADTKKTIQIQMILLDRLFTACAIKAAENLPKYERLMRSGLQAQNQFVRSSMALDILENGQAPQKLAVHYHTGLLDDEARSRYLAPIEAEYTSLWQGR